MELWTSWPTIIPQKIASCFLYIPLIYTRYTYFFQRYGLLLQRQGQRATITSSITFLYFQKNQLWTSWQTAIPQKVASLFLFIPLIYTRYTYFSSVMDSSSKERDREHEYISSIIFALFSKRKWKFGPPGRPPFPKKSHHHFYIYH